MAKDTVKRSSGGSGKGKGTKAARIGLQEAIRGGVAAVERGEREAAYKIFRDTADGHPEASEAWVWLAGASPNLEEAEAAFEKAYSLDPNNEQASLGLRWVRLRRKATLNQIMGESVPMPTQDGAKWGNAVQATQDETWHPDSALAALPIACPNCGKQNAASERFCVDCGQDLRSNSAQAPGGAAIYEGKTIKRRAISTRALVAIVFAVLVVAAAVYWLMIMPR